MESQQLAIGNWQLALGGWQLASTWQQQLPLNAENSECVAFDQMPIAKCQL
jgi:hypothetical protein